MMPGEFSAGGELGCYLSSKYDMFAVVEEEEKGPEVLFNAAEHTQFTYHNNVVYEDGVWTFTNSKVVFGDLYDLPEHNFEISLKFKTSSKHGGLF